MTEVVTPQRSVWYRLYHGETTFDFVGRRSIPFAISGILIVVTVVSLLVQGLNLGIDFVGGVSWEFDAHGLTADQARTIVGGNGIAADDVKVQELSGSEGTRLRIQSGAQTAAVEAAVKDALSQAANGAEVSVNTVSPTWGAQVTRKAITALIVFFVLIAVYISWRFEWKMALAALAAVPHDMLLSVGIYSLFGFEVTPATVIAFLTILGFSLYDTIVVFDKVLDNTKKLGTRVPYADIVNLSMNQTIMRSMNTTIAAVLPVLSILLIGAWGLGAVALEEFALALLVGLILGSYSSLFVATPVLEMLKGREKGYRDVLAKRARAAELDALRTSLDEHGAPARRRAAVAASGADGGPPSATQNSAVRPPEVLLTHPPRPRKKRRR